MKTLTTFTLLPFLLLALLSVAAAIPPSAKQARISAPDEPRGPVADISSACATAKDKDFCVKTLNSNPQSKGKDLRSLTYISLQMAQSKSSDIDGFIANKLRHEESLEAKVDDALNECDDVYDDTTAVIEDAIAAFFHKNFADMRKYMTAAMRLGDKCEQEFKDAKMKAVIGDNNTVFTKLCGNSLALIDAWQKAGK